MKTVKGSCLVLVLETSAFLSFPVGMMLPNEQKGLRRSPQVGVERQASNVPLTLLQIPQKG